MPEGLVVADLALQRNRAWDIHPYPCLGQFRFLELNLSKRVDVYPRLLSMIKKGGNFMDIGCCLGQDLRKLIFDAVLGIWSRWRHRATAMALRVP